MLAQILCLSLVFAAVTGASPAPPPADLETREPNSKKTVTCKTLYKGVLSTAQFYNIDSGGNYVGHGHYGHYTFDSQNNVAFYNVTHKPKIIAEFQACDPNYAGVPGTTKDAQGFVRGTGRVYVPAIKKCLAVTNPQVNGLNQPYFLQARDCGTPTASASSIPFNFVLSHGYDSWQKRTITFVWWIGAAGAPGKNQGTCYTVGAPSTFGYKYDIGDGVPIMNSGQFYPKMGALLGLVCDDYSASGTYGAFAEFTSIP